MGADVTADDLATMVAQGPTDHSSSPPFCRLCRDEFILYDGAEATPFCDGCAHKAVAILGAAWNRVRGELADALAIADGTQSMLTQVTRERDRLLAAQPGGEVDRG